MIATGCEYSFEPIKKDAKQYFSMYGYLDATADTQWVRIAPTRDQLEVPDVKPEMEVKLKELETGKTVVMNDSLFLSVNGLNYLNSWTTFDIKPEQSYVLEAELPDGTSSSVSMTIPKDFPTPNLRLLLDGCEARLDINGVETLADVQSVWHVRLLLKNDSEKRFIRIPYRSEIIKRSSGNYTVYLDTEVELNQISKQTNVIPDSIDMIQRDIFVAAGGPEWIDHIDSIDDKEYALPEGLSNVTNGVGYVFGIASKTVSYEPKNDCVQQPFPF